MSSVQLNSDALVGSPAAGQIEYNGQFYATDSSSSRAQMQRLVQGTAQATTSGTSITFSSIPSWVKRITVMFNGVSLSGTANHLIQLGSGSATTTGYSTLSAYIQTTVATTANTTGFFINSGNAAAALSGIGIFTNVSGNTWVGSINMSTPSGTALVALSNGTITLSGTLDRVIITTTNGTDTFDAGFVNIIYEG